MIFCGVELAARIERVEGKLIASLAGAARRRAGPAGAEVFVSELAGGVAAWAGEGLPQNKVVGLGFAGVPAAADLDAVERAYHQRGAVVQIELSNLAAPGIAPLLTGRGYRLLGFENVLGARLPATGGVAADVNVSETTPQGAWTNTIVEGFAHPDQQGVVSAEVFPREVVEQAFADVIAAEGFRFFIAHRAGEIGGAASMRVADGVAQLSGAATLPAHRRRGVQSSLLAARMAAAGAAGCDLAVVTTQPGSKSQENAQRRGFALLYTRAILVLPPAPAATSASRAL